MVRRTVGRGKSFLVACAGRWLRRRAVRAGCVPTSDRPASTAELAFDESDRAAGEPRRLDAERIMADPLVPVGFRSRQPAETMPEPEISLGTEVESVTPSDRPAGAAQQTATQPPADTTLRLRRLAAWPPCRRHGRAAEPAPVERRRAAGGRAPVGRPPGRCAGAARLPPGGCGAVYSARQHFLEALARPPARWTWPRERRFTAGRWPRAIRRSSNRGSSLRRPERASIWRGLAVHRTAVLKSVPLDQLSSIVAQHSPLERLPILAWPGPPADNRPRRWHCTRWAKRRRRCSPPVRSCAGRRWANRSPATRQRLACDPRNHLAANELGVILAESGRLDAARDLFLFLCSLAISEHAATWQNLALTLARWGDTAAASRAAVRAERRCGPSAWEPVTGDNVTPGSTRPRSPRNPSAGDGQFPPAVAHKPSAAPRRPPLPRRQRNGWHFSRGPTRRSAKVDG